MTSPNLNYFLIAGALLMLGSIYIGVLPTTEEQVAHVQCIVSTLLQIGRYYSTRMCYYLAHVRKIVRILLNKLSDCPNTNTLLHYCN